MLARQLAAAAFLLVFTASDVKASLGQQAPKLTGTDAIGAASQGSSVSLSADGSTAVVGAPADNAGQDGERKAAKKK